MKPERDKARADAEFQKLLDRQREEDDMRWLMGDERGRRLVWQWLDWAGLFRTSYAPEALAIAFAEGQRNMGLRLHAQVMEHAPQQFVRMLAEAQVVSGAHTATRDSDTAAS